MVPVTDRVGLVINSNPAIFQSIHLKALMQKQSKQKGKREK
jgi:hypothetical protein